MTRHITAGSLSLACPPAAEAARAQRALLDAGGVYTGILCHMTNDPRSALNRLIAAFEAHLDAAATGDADSPVVVAAENALQDAFFTYDDALFTATGIELPFDIVDAEDGDDDADYDDDDDFEDGEDDYDDDLDDDLEDDLEETGYDFDDED